MCVAPITAARGTARYPAEVPIAAGDAGQTKPGVILCHQVRTITVERIASAVPEGYLAPGAIRAAVRAALAHHLGLDIPAVVDGARIPPE
jgi:mRNA-degrading endonuclease toxin of MazEF toxin-antitoxin module